MRQVHTQPQHDTESTVHSERGIKCHRDFSAVGRYSLLGCPGGRAVMDEMAFALDLERPGQEQSELGSSSSISKVAEMAGLRNVSKKCKVCS